MKLKRKQLKQVWANKKIPCRKKLKVNWSCLQDFGKSIIKRGYIQLFMLEFEIN